LAIDPDIGPCRIPEVAFPSVQDSLVVVAARRSSLPTELEQAKSAFVNLAAARDSTKGTVLQRHASVHRRLAELTSTEAELQTHLRHQQCESSAVSRKRLALLQKISGFEHSEPATDGDRCDDLREEFEQFSLEIRETDRPRLQSTLVKLAHELADLRDAQRRATATAKDAAGAKRCGTEWVEPVFALLQGRMAARIRMPAYV
jgi:chromosome segregation ATPase